MCNADAMLAIAIAQYISLAIIAICAIIWAVNAYRIGKQVQRMKREAQEFSDYCQMKAHGHTAKPPTQDARSK